MLSRDFADRIMGNANKIFMALESTQTALEAERYWGEEIARKQSYQLTEGHSDSGKFLSPLRFINPQRSKTLQDRKQSSTPRRLLTSEPDEGSVALRCGPGPGHLSAAPETAQARGLTGPLGPLFLSSGFHQDLRAPSLWCYVAAPSRSAKQTLSFSNRMSKCSSTSSRPNR